MNPLALYFASGESLYPGCILLILIIALSFLKLGKWSRRLLSLGIWVALALIIMACPPLHWSAWLALATLLPTWIIAASLAQRAQKHHSFHIATSIALALLAISIALLEFPHRLMPPHPLAPAHHLTIIGDSITAGISDDSSRWPVLLQKQTGIPFKDLSRPGDQVDDAIRAAKRLTPDDALLLIEIGGNDLIAGVPTADFERSLRTLLESCTSQKRTILMFELPLLPHRIGYGRAQRRLATEFHVTLIPKRHFVQVLRAGTSDGLHLSPAGAQAMATLVRDIINPASHPPHK